MDDYYRVPLSTGEAMATIAALRVVCALLQKEGVVSDLAPEIFESAAARIEAELPEFLAGAAQKLRPGLAESLAQANFDAKTDDKDSVPVTLRTERTRRLLETAWRSASGVAEIEYFVASRNEWTTRRVEISDVYETDTGWYLEGECQLRRDHRMFRLDNIRAVRSALRPVDDENDDDLFDPFDEEGNA